MGEGGGKNLLFVFKLFREKNTIKTNEHVEEKRFYDVRLGFVSVPTTPCTIGYYTLGYETSRRSL